MEKASSDSANSGGIARRDASAPSAADQQIGTGHGQRRYDPVTQTQFERESLRPNQQVALYYDSHEALLARGVINEWRSPQQPEPFPIGFVPDPR